MLRLLFGAALAFGVLLGSAQARWVSDTGQDPLSDEPFAFMASEEKGPSSTFTLMAKCWRKTPEQGLLAVMTPFPYDASAQYKDEVYAQFRIDKGEVRTLRFEPRNMSGKFGMVWRHDGVAAYTELLEQVASAKHQIALSLMNAVHVYPARGSTKAARALIRTCALTDAVQADKDVASAAPSKSWLEMQPQEFERSVNSKLGTYVRGMQLKLHDCDRAGGCLMKFGREDVGGNLFLEKESGNVSGFNIMTGGGVDANETIMTMMAVWKSCVDVVEVGVSNKRRQSLMASMFRKLASGDKFVTTTDNASYEIRTPEGLGVWFTVLPKK